MLDSPEIRYKQRKLMGNGVSYASALSQAMEDLHPSLASVFSNPNDTLGVEYCRALDKLASNIQPYCVTRVGANHDCNSPSEVGLPVSASYIRLLLHQCNGEDELESLRSYMPTNSFEVLRNHITTLCAPADISRLDRAIIMKLRTMSVEELSQLPDVSEGLENRIGECASFGGADVGFSSLADNIKCKRYTHARIRRILLSALLGIASDDSIGTPPYIRVLAMNHRGKEILSAASSCGKLPIVTRYSQLASLDDRSKRIFSLCAAANDIHGLTLPIVPPSGRDYTQKLIVEK